MLKNILVPLTGFAHDANALEAAYVAGWPFDAAIEALHVQPEPIEIVLQAALQQFAIKKSNRELVLSLQHEAVSCRQRAREAFEQFSARRLAAHAFASAQSGVTATLRQTEGSPVHDTTAAARFCDLIVLARAAQDAQFTADAIANILVGCGRPVLLVPDAAFDAIGSTIAIAWKEKAESARAVGAAMPLLARAKRVLVLSVNETGGDMAPTLQSAEHLARQLARHGMNVEAHGLAAPPHPGPEILLHKAKELGANLVVAGAYSHSRVRELVFGGFTRSLLAACDLPLMLLH